LKSIDQIRSEAEKEKKGATPDCDTVIFNLESAIKDAITSPDKLIPNAIKVIIPKGASRAFDELHRAGYEFRFKEEVFNSATGKMCSLYEIHWK
jgi:hypothetical protein